VVKHLRVLEKAFGLVNLCYYNYTTTGYPEKMYPPVIELQVTRS